MALGRRPLASAPLGGVPDSGVSPATGTLSSTLGALTSTANATVEARASTSATLGAVTSAAVAIAQAQATATPTLGAVASTASAAVEASATATPTLATVTASATAAATATAACGTALGALTATTQAYAYDLAHYPPTADVTVGGWTASGGGSLYAMLDEASPSDADYDLSSTSPTADTMEVRFGGVQTPSVPYDQTVSYRIRGEGGVPVVVKLQQGAATIATWTHDPAPASYTTYDQALTAGQIAAISDYTDLRLRVTAN